MSSEWLIMAGAAALIGVVGKREFDRRARRRRDLDNLADALFNGIEDDEPWKSPDGDDAMRGESNIDGAIVEPLAARARAQADCSWDACFAELSPPFKGGVGGGRIEGQRDVCFALTAEKERLGTWRVSKSRRGDASGGWRDERTRRHARKAQRFIAPAAPSSRRGRIWLMSFGLIAAFCLFRGLGSLDSTPPKRAATSAAPHGERLPSGLGSPLDQFVPTRIDEIRPGRKVLGENPTGDLDVSLGLDVVPAQWRLVDLVCAKRDGSWADVRLLRPLWWLEERHAAVGGTIEVSVPECGIDGTGQVLAIGPCPPIRAGPGRIVTGTFRHHSAKVIELSVEGLDEPIGTTGNHPFWSVDRQQFVRADDLRTGERLRSSGDESGSGGTARVFGVRPLPGEHTVYNLEVQGSHVYHVAQSGILVHNGGLKYCFTNGTLDDPVQIGGFANPKHLLPTHRIQVHRGQGKLRLSALRESIRANGIREPVKIFELNGRKYILDGHHRVRAAFELGLKEVPVESVNLPYGAYKTFDDVFDYFSH